MPPSHKLECPSCGAPLRWKGEAPVVACRYCGTHVHTPSGQPTAEPAVVRSQGHGGGKAGCIVFLVVIGINLVVALIALVSAVISDGPGSIAGVHVDKLVALSLEGDNATVAEALGLAPDEEGDNLHVPLRGSGFDYAYLGWDDEHPGHVASFGLYAGEGHPEAASRITQLQGILGRRLVLDGETWGWHWADGYLHAADDLSNLGFHADPDDDPHWQYRMQLLWSACTAVATGKPFEPSDDTRTAWLAHGYDMGDLAAMDLRYDVDSVRAYMPSVFPGAHEAVFSGLDFTIPLAHPWFGQVELSWPNQAGGTIESAGLRPAPGHQSFPDPLPIRQCLDKALGQGEVRVDDHLKGSWSARWTLNDEVWLHLGQYSLTLHLDNSRSEVANPARKSRLRASAWKKVFRALEGCG